MNIKAGQWYRTKRGVFNNISSHASGGEYYMTNGDEITAVADTPQELVKVGDLVEIDGEIMKVPFVEKVGESEFIFNRLYRDITAIYTPNKDKTQYTLQWRKE